MLVGLYCCAVAEHITWRGPRRIGHTPASLRIVRTEPRSRPAVAAAAHPVDAAIEVSPRDRLHESAQVARGDAIVGARRRTARAIMRAVLRPLRNVVPGIAGRLQPYAAWHSCPAWTAGERSRPDSLRGQTRWNRMEENLLSQLARSGAMLIGGTSTQGVPKPTTLQNSTA